MPTCCHLATSGRKGSNTRQRPSCFSLSQFSTVLFFHRSDVGVKPIHVIRLKCNKLEVRYLHNTFKIHDIVWNRPRFSRPLSSSDSSWGMSRIGVMPYIKISSKTVRKFFGLEGSHEKHDRFHTISWILKVFWGYITSTLLQIRRMTYTGFTPTSDR